MRVKLIDHTLTHRAPEYRSHIANWSTSLNEAMVEFKRDIPELDIRYQDDGSVEIWNGDEIRRTYIPEGHPDF